MRPEFISQTLQNGVDAGAFPGATVALRRGGVLVLEAARGNYGIEAPFLRPVSPATIYDLASVSKIYTLAVALNALRAAKIGHETPLNRFFPAFDARISVENLMTHASGISFAVQELENVAAAEWVGRVAAAPLKSEPGTAALYSCTNFFLLARLAEKLRGASLDELIQSQIVAPLGLENTGFAPPNLEIVAPTERKKEGAEFWHGIVHDEAARSWRAQTGTSCGNAGVFAPASEIARFAQIWANAGENVLHPDDAARAFMPLVTENSHHRSAGFQINAAFYMTDAAPKNTAGHTGFTGPTMLVTPAGDVAVMLNNRVHPTRNGPERMAFHRAVAGEFFAR